MMPTLPAWVRVAVTRVPANTLLTSTFCGWSLMCVRSLRHTPFRTPECTQNGLRV